jgi:hypothetical protein
LQDPDIQVTFYSMLNCSRFSMLISPWRA